MSRDKAILLGILTAWPLVYMGIFMLSVFGMFLLGGHPATLFPFAALMVLHLLTMLLVVVLLVIYIVYVFQSDRVPQDLKALWAVVLFLGNAVAMMVFWYIYIWKQPEPKDDSRLLGGS